MKNLKKLPTKQLEKFSNIFTQLGLVLVLFIVYITLEHQTEEKSFAIKEYDVTQKFYIEPEQNIIFKPEVKVKPKVQLPKQDPFILDKVKEAPNDVIETTVIDLPKEETPIDLNTIVTEKEEPTSEPIEDVPFINIEDAPVFKGCEGLSKKENKICFEKKMKQFVERNFDIELANELGLNSGKYRINTQFLIDDKGNVVDIKVRAPHHQLKKEADRLINKLPKFTPGKQRNKPVKVRYTLPISFNVQ